MRKKPINTPKRTKIAAKKAVKKSTSKAVKNASESVKKKPTSNFENYNIIRTEIARQLQDKGTKYSKKELHAYTKEVLDSLKKQYKTKNDIANALKYIEDRVSDLFVSEPTYEIPPAIVWYSIATEINILGMSADIIVDNRELLGNDELRDNDDAIELLTELSLSQKGKAKKETLQEIANLKNVKPEIVGVENLQTADNEFYRGKSFAFDNFFTPFAHKMNELLKRKDYAYFIEVFFRDENKEKEFFYYLLVEDGNWMVEAANSGNYAEIIEYIKQNKILNIDAIFDSLDVVSAFNSAKTVKEVDLKKPKTPIYPIDKKGNVIVPPNAKGKKGKAKEPKLEPKVEPSKPKKTEAEKPSEKEVELKIEQEKTKQKASVLESIREIKSLISDGVLTKKEGADAIKQLLK